MACGNDSCTDRLNREWTLLQRRPAPPGWPDETATLADVLAGIATDPDRCLGQLLTWHAAGDELAGRVVLQAMLGKLVLLAARDPWHDDADDVTECWFQLCRYPLARRPRRVAANLAMDTRRAVWAGAIAPPVLDPALIDQRPAVVEPDATALIRAATRLGLIDRAASACLIAVYCLGLRSHEAAERLSISPELVRWRNARSIRTLAPHAATLAAAAA